MTCTMTDCPNPVAVKRRGLCKMHVQRLYRHGDPAAWYPDVARRCKAGRCPNPPTHDGMCEEHHYRLRVWPLPPVLVEPRPGWHLDAACLDAKDPDAWYPVDTPSVDVIKTCEGCPVRGDCLAAGLHEDYGVFGGMGGEHRRKLRRELGLASRPYAVLQPCGTEAAYQRHIRRGERPCESCSEANRVYKADRKAS